MSQQYEMIGYRATGAKLLIARVLGSAPVGRVVGRLTRDRVPHYGLRIDTSDPVVAPEVKARILFRIYERAEIGMIRRYLVKGQTVVELGSSIGVGSAHILDRIGPSGKLVAVEANRDLLTTLMTVLAAAISAERCSIIPCAVVGEGTTATFLPSKSTVAGKLGAGTDVPAIRLSRLVDEYVDGRYLLVADVEGAELQILRSDPESLDRCDGMIIELHPVEGPSGTVTPHDLVDMIEALGFRLVESRGPVCFFSRPQNSEAG